MAEETADDAAFGGADPIWGDEVGDDGVVVAGVEGDVVPAGVDDGADHVERLVAVERGDLDGDDVGDLGEAAARTNT